MEHVGNGDVVVIDEAGMVGTRQLARVAKQLQMRGCKLVLVGDPDQLQPIRAGTPFRDIVQTNGAAHLTEIRRQTSDWQRQASQDLARGQTGAALQSYANHGAVHEEQTRDQAITTLVDDYMADFSEYGEAKSRLALAHRRVDVHAINQAIKAARMAKSETIAEILFETDHGPRAFAPGDRILFTRNNATLGVRGVRQDSCRLSSFQAVRLANAAMGPPPPASCGSASADPWPLRSASGRSGFSQTEPMGCQLRVLPDHRSGWAARAVS